MSAFSSSSSNWEDRVKLLSLSDDFSTNFVDDYYLYRKDWYSLRNKFVAINQGMQGMDEVLSDTKTDMLQCFSEVILNYYTVVDVKNEI